MAAILNNDRISGSHNSASKQQFLYCFDNLNNVFSFINNWKSELITNDFPFDILSGLLRVTLD